MAINIDISLILKTSLLNKLLNYNVIIYFYALPQSARPLFNTCTNGTRKSLFYKIFKFERKYTNQDFVCSIILS